MNSILLIPGEKDPHGLLTPGPCFARPPRAFPLPYLPVPGSWEPTPLGEEGSALILAWNGEICPEGCDRVLRRLAAALEADGEAVHEEIGLVWIHGDFPDPDTWHLHDGTDRYGPEFSAGPHARVCLPELASLEEGPLRNVLALALVAARVLGATLCQIQAPPVLGTRNRQISMKH